MSRRILTLVLFGLSGSLTLSGTVEGGKHRGQTYTYNGSSGVWSGPNCAPCAGNYARPVSYAQPVAYSQPQATVYARQPNYYAAPQAGVPAPAFARAKSAPQR